MDDHNQNRPSRDFRLFPICPVSKEKRQLQVTRQVKSLQSSSEWPIITSATLRHTYLIGKGKKTALDAQGKNLLKKKKKKKINKLWHIKSAGTLTVLIKVGK